MLGKMGHLDVKHRITFLKTALLPAHHCACIELPYQAGGQLSTSEGVALLVYIFICIGGSHGGGKGGAALQGDP